MGELFFIRCTGGNPERQVGWTEADESGEQWQEADQTPQAFEIVTGSKNSEGGDDGEDGFHWTIGAGSLMSAA